MQDSPPFQQPSLFTPAFLRFLPDQIDLNWPRPTFRPPPLEELLAHFDPRAFVADLIALGTATGKRLSR